MSEFDVNINTGNETFKISKKEYPNKLTKDLKIIKLKGLIQFDKEIESQNIILKYNNIIMKNNKILNDYGININNNKNIIQMIVNKSNKNNVNIQKNDNNGISILTPKEKHSIIKLNTAIKSHELLIQQTNIFLNGLSLFY